MRRHPFDTATRTAAPPRSAHQAEMLEREADHQAEHGSLAFGPLGAGAAPPPPEATTRALAGDAEALLQLQRTHGNRHVQQVLQRGRPTAGGAMPVVRKLSLGPLSDSYEREANQVAGHALDQGARRAGSGPLLTPPRIQPVHGTTGEPIHPAVQHSIEQARGHGQSVPDSVRQPLEHAFGRDFGDVRVHTDGRADSLNRVLQARAFTTGHDIFFRRGEYHPGTSVGQRTLAHELAHVVQQAGPHAQSASAHASPDAPIQRVSVKRHRTNGDDEDYQPGEDLYRSGKKPKEPARTSTKRKSASESSEAAPRKKKKETGPRTRGTRRSRSIESRSPSSSPSRSSSPVRTQRRRAASARSSAKKETPRSSKASEGSGSAPPQNTTLDLKGMETYLESQLPQDQVPREISVGVVVWNINHLPEDDDKVETPDKADDDVEALPAEGTSYNFSDFQEPLDNLKTALGEVRKKLVEAINKRIRYVDNSKRRVGSKKDELKKTRKELSQLKTDIDELLKLDPENDVKPLVDALAISAGGTGEAEIEAKATELASLRALNRIWNRVSRVRRILITGKARLGEKIKARDALRNALDEQGKNDIKEEAGELFKKLPVAKLESEISELKQSLIADLTIERFLENDAIDLVLINEMNLGMRAIRERVKRKEQQVGVTEGPLMLAKGKPVEEGKNARTVNIGGTEVHVVGKQYEYYPSIYKKGGERGLASRGTFYVDTSGKFIVQEGNKESGIFWDKAGTTASYRGIVVHRLVQNEQEFWAGVIHTTPAGHDLHRDEIWPQIRIPLKNLNKLAKKFQIPLLVGGDFYIPAEGIVNKPSKDEMKAIQDKHPELLPRIKHQYLARTVYNAIPQKKRTGDWKHYSKRIKSFIEKNKKVFQGKQAIQFLAPGVKFAKPSEMWKKTAVGGDIDQSDIIRNLGRKITLEKAIKNYGYRVVDAGNPTNPKERGKRENKMQLADLYLVNEHWPTTMSGILTPGGTKLRTVDDELLSATKTYWKVSDHSPVALVASTKKDDVELYRRFDIPKEAWEQARQANQNSWAEIAMRLGLHAEEAHELTGQITDQIGEVVKLLGRQPADDTRDPLLALQDDWLKAQEIIKTMLATILAEGLVSVSSDHDLQEILLEIMDWQPYYPLDFGEVKFSLDGARSSTTEPSTPSGTPSSASVPVPGLDQEEQPAESSTTQSLSGQPSSSITYPRGQIEHSDDFPSCYVAALIHVLASDPAYSSLMDKNPNNDLSKLLQPLVQKLGKATDTVSEKEISTVVGRLVELGILTNAAMHQQQDAAEILQEILGRFDESPELMVKIRSTLSAPGSVPGYQNYWIINLPIANDKQGRPCIEASLLAFTAQKNIKDYKYGNSAEPGEVSQQMQFHFLPDVLTLVLNRFDFDKSTNETRKKDQRVHVPYVLNIPRECLTEELQSVQQRYQLIHVTHHSGDSPKSGHYTSLGMMPDDEQWYKHNDMGNPRRRVLTSGESADEIETGYIYVYQRI